MLVTWRFTICLPCWINDAAVVVVIRLFVVLFLALFTLSNSVTLHGVRSDCCRVVESRCRVNSSFQSRNWVKIVFQRVAIGNPRKCRMKQPLLPLLIRRNQGLLPMYHFPRNSTLTKTSLPIGKSRYRFGKRMKLSLGWTNNLQRFVSPGVTCHRVTCIGPDALEIHTLLPFSSDAERQKMDNVLELWQNYCIGRTNVIYERYKFNNRSQEANGSIDANTTALRTLAETCEFGSLKDDLIRDRLVCGIRDNG